MDFVKVILFDSRDHHYANRLLNAVNPSDEKETPENGSNRKLSIGVIITICVLAFIVSKFIIFLFLYWRCSKNRKPCEIKLSGGKMVLFTASGKTTPSSRALLRKIESLTDEDIIGRGGYGTVYRLILDDQSAFAVKKMSRGTPERDKGFERELETLSDIKHRNLVCLRGYYSAPTVNLLIYDLMPNGSLEHTLHGRSPDGEVLLDWPCRHNIALGVACGIAYLHHDCVPHVIHRDIKSSNVLLDEHMEARVSDFGLAKLIDPTHTHATTIIAGTLGYLAPEYVDTGKVTEKGDIYSYGVVLLELVTGRRPTDDIFVQSGITLVSWVRMLVATGRAMEAFDRGLLGYNYEEELREVLELGCQCLDPDPRRRPTMAEVVKRLESMHVKDDDLDVFSISVVQTTDSDSRECSMSISAVHMPDSGSRECSTSSELSTLADLQKTFFFLRG